MKEKGFTLVEMLLVLAIIGILVTILLPSVFGVTRDAKEKQVKGDLRLIQAALGEYYIRYNTFPANGAGWEQLLLDMRPRIIKDQPVDPFDPNRLLYGYHYLTPAAPGDVPTYVVWSKGWSQMEDAGVQDYDLVYHTADCIYVSNASQDTATTP